MTSATAQSPGAIFWRHFRRSRPAVAGAIVLAIFYFSAVVAPIVATYAPETQYRDNSYQPPTRLHWRDATGRFHAWPFVYAVNRSIDGDYTERTDRTYPLRLFTRGDEYSLFGIRSNIHVLGVDRPAFLFLAGSDALGRDIFSRLVYGGRVSLSVGLIGVAITFAIGLLVGAAAGYYGGVVDATLMRFAELLLSMPFLYLVLALRAAFPTNMPSAQTYLMIVAILAFISWAGLARVIRGIVLSLRRNEYVLAAQALGYSTSRILVRHILPNTMSFTIVAATISIPAYILGEVVLSFLGAGIQEPTPSWGNMLNAARSATVLTHYPWVLAPGGVIFLTVMAFNFLGDGLRDALDPRRIQGM